MNTATQSKVETRENIAVTALETARKKNLPEMARDQIPRLYRAVKIANENGETNTAAEATLNIILGGTVRDESGELENTDPEALKKTAPLPSTQTIKLAVAKNAAENAET